MNEEKSVGDDLWCIAPKPDEVLSDDENISMGSWDVLSEGDLGGGVFQTQTQREIQEMIDVRYKSTYYKGRVMELEDEDFTEQELSKITSEIVEELPELMSKVDVDTDSEYEYSDDKENQKMPAKMKKGEKKKAPAPPVVAKTRKQRLKLLEIQDKEKTQGLTTKVLEDITPANKTTKNKYTGYVADFYEFNQNEKGKGIEDEVTVCNFFSFLKHNRFKASSLWCVYTAINGHYKKVTGGKKLQNMMLLQTLMRNTTRHYIHKKAKVFAPDEISKLFDQGLLKESKPDHLEMKVGGLLAIYGLLRCCELLKLALGDVLQDLLNKDALDERGTNEQPFEVHYPYSTKTREECFSFMIPAKYCSTFLKFYDQMKAKSEWGGRFLKNMNNKSKKCVQNLGIKKVEGWPKTYARLLDKPGDLKEYTTHSIR